MNCSLSKSLNPSTSPPTPYPHYLINGQTIISCSWGQLLLGPSQNWAWIGFGTEVGQMQIFEEKFSITKIILEKAFKIIINLRLTPLAMPGAASSISWDREVIWTKNVYRPNKANLNQWQTLFRHVSQCTSHLIANLSRSQHSIFFSFPHQWFKGLKITRTSWGWSVPSSLLSLAHS